MRIYVGNLSYDDRRDGGYGGGYGSDRGGRPRGGRQKRY